MIKINIQLLPGGVGMLRKHIAHANIWSDVDDKTHSYMLRDHDDRVIASGTIPKTQSGHGNIYHTLAAVCDHAIQNDLKDNQDYIKYI